MIKYFLYFAIFICLLIPPFNSLAYNNDVRVNGYYRKDGSYVKPYYRTKPNNTMRDNYSTQGNINPYNGKQGTVRCQGYGC
tara:strand:+ start:158 stop:400 length:243 start_codon:yes stop_codon:yes gene_type:complete